MQSDHEVVIFAFLHPRMYRKVEKMIDYVVLDLSELKDKERPSIPLGPKPPTNGPLSRRDSSSGTRGHTGSLNAIGKIVALS